MDAATECVRPFPFLDLPMGGTAVAVETLALDVDAFICASPIATRAAATTAAPLAGALLFVLFFLAVDDAAGVIFSGAPRLRFFVHPVMRPSPLAAVRCLALRGIGGAHHRAG